MRAGGLFGACRERQFRLLWLGQATSTLGDGLVPVALAFAVIKSLDRGPTALGIVLASGSLPLVVFVLAGGVWAVGSTLVVLLVRGVRNLRRLDEPEPEQLLAGLRAEPAEALHGS